MEAQTANEIPGVIKNYCAHVQVGQRDGREEGTVGREEAPEGRQPAARLSAARPRTTTPDTGRVRQSR